VAAVLTCDPRRGRKSGQFLNPSCFALPSGTNYGDGRNPYMAGPMFWSSDATVMKNFKMTEKQNLEIRFSAFNFMNHALNSFNGGDGNLKLNFNGSGQLANATDPNHACPGPFCQAFGYADYHYGHRELEFGAKYSF
jgi:hypothetical protein